MTKTTAILIAGLAIATLPARAYSEQKAESAQTVIVVVGAPGAEQYAAQFTESAQLWKQACSRANAKFIPIGLTAPADPNDRTLLKNALTEEAENNPSTLWLVLIGHGTFDGRAAKFNLRGPDITAADLSSWLAPVLAPTAVINTTASSAPFLKKLSSPNRAVITATKSGFEQNYARFGQYFTAAIVDPAADLDKDGQTSLLEAFLTASHRVTEYYAAAGQLVTEHALLDDNGDTLGTRADWFRGIRAIEKPADNAELDGYRAHQFHLIFSQDELEMPQTLRTQRNRLELDVMKLRDNRDNLPEAEYFQKLENLLQQIARIYEQPDPNAAQ